MKYTYLLLVFVLFSCATGKDKKTTTMQNLTVEVDIVKNQMPTTDGKSNNYAIVKLHAGGDTLQENWSLSQFTLMNENKDVLHQINGQNIDSSNSHKSALGMNINVRDLPADIPATVLVRVIFLSDSKNEFSFETDPIQPMVVQ